MVAFAAKRYVTVVPEIEMPGHSQAAIAAYPELGNRLELLQMIDDANEGNVSKRPAHFKDPFLEVHAAWGVNPNVFNVEDHTLVFLMDVLTEVLQLFPSKFIHIGGDECPKLQWKAAPSAQNRIDSLGL